MHTTPLPAARIPVLRALVCMHAELLCKHNTTEMPELPATAVTVVCKHAKQSKPCGLQT